MEALWEGLPANPLLVSHFNSRLLPVVRLVRTAGNWRGRAAGAAGTDFWLPVGPVNRLLEEIFAGESRRLVGLLHGRRRPYAAGASLIAVLRRA